MMTLRKFAHCLVMVTASWYPTSSVLAESTGSTMNGIDDATREKCFAILRKAVKSDEFWPAMHAAEALSLAGAHNEVRELLTPMLSASGFDQRQQCGIARELVRTGDREQTATLLKILADKDSFGHTHACESLYKVSEVGDRTLLRTAMNDDQQPIKALMAAAALARHGEPGALDHIRAQVKSTDDNNARVAAWILGAIGDQSDIPALTQRKQSIQDEAARAYFDNALAVIGDPSGQQALLKNLKNANPAIRTDAAYFAGEANLPEARPLLISLLDDPTLDVTVRAAQSLLKESTAIAKSEGTPATPTGPKVVLQLAPGENNSRNSEGDFIQLNDGRILFIYSHFTTGRGGDHDSADLRERISTDGGKTWSDSERVVIKSDDGLNVMSVSLLRLQDGRIALFYLRKHSLKDCRPIMRISTDEGATWGPPTQCINDEVGYYVLNNNRAIQLKSGRIVLPVCLHQRATENKADWAGELMCYFSDDNGTTWRRSKSLLKTFNAEGKRVTTQEPGVVELKDGRVMMFIRANPGCQMLSYSSDGGDTWTDAVESDIKSPLSPASIERIPSTGDLLLVWNDHANIAPELKNFRTPLTVAVSKDDGKTWVNKKNLFADPERWYCYMAIDFVGDSVLVGHCAGKRVPNGLTVTDITRFDLAWLYGDQK
ncbi:exo-alpha-sialidase [Planctomicrobium sp. SH527]|uniref:exo-alpha-sialidase n=1 Tax=Planctomicrobium sp. SH527 TaxID=3448123 RepID=UPI003F5BA527